VNGVRWGARGFACSVAARYAPSSRPHRHIRRVFVHFGRRAVTAARRRPLHAGLTLRLTHRLIAEDHTRTMLARTQTLVERVERHVATTRQIVERTQRVEQVAMRSGNFSQLTTSARSQGTYPVSARIVVPALPRVLRRPAPPAEPPAPARASSAEPVRQRHVAATPPIDVARLTDEVMRGIDKRIAAWRERRGRV
jgi:hypothetical protein